MNENVAFLVAAVSLSTPTLSIDDDYFEEMLWIAVGWFGTALMVWREYEFELPKIVP